MDQDALQAGLGARFLLVMPPERRRIWTEATIPNDLVQRYQGLLRALLDLQLLDVTKRRPKVLGLSDPAKRLWVQFYNEWGAVQYESEGEQRSAFAKIEAYASRFMLLHHVVSHVTAGQDDGTLITESSALAGIALARWFAAEAVRVYLSLAESIEERDARRLVEWIQSRGGKVTAKELQKSNSRKYRTSEDATNALESLVEAGYGRWVDRPAGARGGKPTRDFILHPTTDDTDDTYPEGGDDGGTSTHPSDDTPKPSDDTPQNPQENEVSSVSSVVGTGFPGSDSPSRSDESRGEVSSGAGEVSSDTRLAPLLSSDSVEWYSPPEVLDAVQDCLGTIALDPCSNNHEAPNVPALRHFTAADDGLSREWDAPTVYMNPPYGRTIAAWVEKLLGEYQAGRVGEAVALLPARTDTNWFHSLHTLPVCYIRGRLKFSGSKNSAPFPSCLVYLGNDPEKFRRAVGHLGTVTGSPPTQGAATPAHLLVQDQAALATVAAALDGTTLVGLDLETTGLDPRADRVRLLSLATDTIDGGTFSFLVDVFAVDPSFLWEALAGKDLVLHNAAFDLAFLARLGFTPDGAVRDTMQLAQLLVAGTYDKVSLAVCCERWLGRTLDKEAQQSDWSGTLTDEQLAYAARDVEVLGPLYQILTQQIQEANLGTVAEIERCCQPAVTWMSREGVAFDRSTWKALAQSAGAEADGLREKLYRAAPAQPGELYDSWNFDSPQQVQQMLTLADCAVENTADEALAAVNHPLADLLRQYRAAAKKVSTYGTDWLAHVQSDGRVYCGWKQLGTRSGRMSCTKPNLQQLPRGEYRRCVVAPHGRVLVKADYSQIELRIAAKVSGDQALLNAYVRGDDLHTLTARNVLGIAEVTKEHRQLAKALNFGLLYGMGAEGFRQYAKSQYGQELTEEEAQTYRSAFFRTYPGLKRWHCQTGRSGKEAIETRTLAGRRRLDVARYTEKLNSPIQGTGADGLKLALALLWERRGQVPGAFPVLAVHDEIVVEADAGQADAVAAWLKDAMVEAMVPLIDPVPVEVEAKVAQTWGGE